MAAQRAGRALLPGTMSSTGCAQEKLLPLEAVHNGRKLSTLGISRATLYASSETAALAPAVDAPVWRTAGRRTLYGSIMCSTTAARIVRICRAIEELAGRSGQHGGASASTAAAVESEDAAGASGVYRTGGARADDEVVEAGALRHGCSWCGERGLK